jgi:hypothetical protein
MIDLTLANRDYSSLRIRNRERWIECLSSEFELNRAIDVNRHAMFSIEFVSMNRRGGFSSAQFAWNWSNPTTITINTVGLGRARSGTSVSVQTN